jgi:hypothetical protein
LVLVFYLSAPAAFSELQLYQHPVLHFSSYQQAFNFSIINKKKPGKLNLFHSQPEIA